MNVRQAKQRFVIHRFSEKSHGTVTEAELSAAGMLAAKNPGVSSLLCVILPGGINVPVPFLVRGEADVSR